ncbi:unnamed protein product [Allacma fusca]|uniref:Tc1-like transposase DDE domain-containing protein n=1 Tax=Allacma fusca TaxID=39272 RepID=A0A8J2P599_9HEXA|nr:unnamed protein product [Allacma fusca]
MLAWIQQQKYRGYQVIDGFERLRNWELQEIIRNLKTLAPHHKLDQYARERGHEIVRIPPYQCELNPIEEVWKDIKHELKKQNIDQNINNQYERAKVILPTYSKEKSAAHVSHIKKLERNYWEMDGFFDEFLTQNPEIEAIVTNGEELDINPEGETYDDNQFDTNDSSCDEEEC